MAIPTESAGRWRGADVIDASGEKVGTVEEIYLDQESDQAEWALVRTGLFSGRSSFVPLVEATPDGDRLRVPYEKDRIKDAPRIDPDHELSQDEERELYAFYGMGYSESESGSGLPELGDDDAGGSEDSPDG